MTLKELMACKLPKDPYHIDWHYESDDYGEYLTGTFSYKSHLVVVSIKNGRWHLSVKSKTPLGMHQIGRLRDTFIPNNVKMAHIIPPREERYEDAKKINLWQVE